MSLSTLIKPLLSLFKAYAADAAADYTEAMAVKAVKKNQNSILKRIVPTLFVRKKYYKEVLSRISDMPFIYNNVSIQNSLENFIEIEVKNKYSSYANDENFRKDKVSISSKINWKILMENIKLIVDGKPGIGKTTLFSFIVYGIVKRKKISNYEFYRKGLTPVYIPLKAVKNLSPSPILTYLLENIPLFNRPGGLAYLKEVLTNRNLFLLLDGYDEISFTENDNYMLDEISILLSEFPQFKGREIKAEYLNLYQMMPKAKVWLTTREQFHKLNPVLVKTDEILNNIQALEITGLGQNRALYVKHIFDYFKKDGDFYETFLNEEVFIQNIDQSNDDELINLSKVPLILNIMCYILVKQVEKDNELKFEWNISIEELITEFVKILISDLDNYKVKGLSLAERLAFKRRRSAYTAEKLKFLPYFALKLINEHKSVFNLSYLDSAVKEFFQINNDEKASRQILNDYKHPKNSINPTFSKQLIYSGIFNVVDVQNSEIYYDMPHRRFKEVLAMKANADDNETLLNNILKPEFSEQILLGYEINEKLRYKIVSYVFTIMNKDNFDYLNKILLNLFQKYYDEEVNNALLRAIKISIEEKYFIRISKSLLQYVTFTENFIDELEQIFSSRNQDPYDNSIVFSLLFIGNQQKLESILREFKLSGNSEMKRRNEILILKYKIIFLVIKFHTAKADFSLKAIIEKCFPLKIGKYKLTTISKMLFYLAAAASNEFNSKIFEKIISSQLGSTDILESLLFLKGLSVFNNDLFEKYKSISEYYFIFRLFDEFTTMKENFSFSKSETLNQIQDELNLINRKLEIAKDTLAKFRIGQKDSDAKQKMREIETLDLLKSRYSDLIKNIKVIDNDNINDYHRFFIDVNLSNFMFLDKLFY